jgi:hypothetical protein
MINNDLSKQEATAKVSYIETRNIPFLSNPSDYYLAVSSFSLETPSLPVFVPSVEIGQPNINKLIYRVIGEIVDIKLKENKKD